MTRRFTVMHGYGSATALHDLAVESLEDDSRDLEILYVGDWDPSGMHMSAVDLPERIERYGGIAKVTRTAPDCVGLTPFDVETKKSDSRHRWFTENYGDDCIELDAMDPNDLRDKVRNEILDRIEPEAWERCREAESAERKNLTRLVKAWPTK